MLIHGMNEKIVDSDQLVSSKSGSLLFLKRYRFWKSNVHREHVLFRLNNVSLTTFEIDETISLSPNLFHLSPSRFTLYLFVCLSVIYQYVWAKKMVLM